MKRVLMVAYHFPPIGGGSGVQRTLQFTRYLPQFGWEPAVLTVHPRAYPAVSEAGLAALPPGLRVRRAFALDTARHLAVRGAYPGLLAVPDRWWTWCLGAIPSGLALMREFKPDVLWSTYPIATAHLIGLALHRLTGTAWVADFRDPMHDAVYPYAAMNRSAHRRIEARAVAACARAVVTAPGTRRLFEERYPGVPASRFELIANGYDEEDFAAAERGGPQRARGAPGKLVLLHSGALYPVERNPDCFFGALADLQKAGTIAGDNVKIVLRATGHDGHLRALVERHGVGSLVELAPLTGYREALEEMLTADGLLVFQAANCNHQIPVKLYEYLRARRPILALTDPAGDTAGALRAAGVDTIAPLDSRAEIARQLARFIELARAGRAPLAAEAAVAGASRRARTAELARLLDDVAGTSATETHGLRGK